MVLELVQRQALQVGKTELQRIAAERRCGQVVQWRGGAYTPLFERPMGASYEERIEVMTGARLQRHQKHNVMREAAMEARLASMQTEVAQSQAAFSQAIHNTVEQNYKSTQEIVTGYAAKTDKKLRTHDKAL